MGCNEGEGYGQMLRAGKALQVQEIRKVKKCHYLKERAEPKASGCLMGGQETCQGQEQ